LAVTTVLTHFHYYQINGIFPPASHINQSITIFVFPSCQRKQFPPTFAREKLAQYVSFPWVKDKVSNVINCRNKLKINKDRK